MKTKIIYISGSEIFDIADIRAAFDEVRNALNLDKNTVLFGVPVDNDDAELAESKPAQSTQPDIPEPEIIESIDIIDEIVEDKIEEPVIEPEPIVEETVVKDVVVEEPVKKRGRKVKAKKEPEIETTSTETPDALDEKIVPILSVLSSKEEHNDTIVEAAENLESGEPENADVEIIEDIVQEKETIPETNNPEYKDITESIEGNDNTEPDLEKLLSAMKPLQEDIFEETIKPTTQETHEPEAENIDATLELLATEFVQTQDKIAAESKSAGRGRIGKLRNILPFKQSKHKDQGLGDLFGWAGVAANDEEFSVPGFFTNASSKK